MKVREDFLLVALHALLRIAAEVVLKDQGPISDVKELAQSIADQFCLHRKGIQMDDKLFLYNTELPTLALIWHNYNDAVKEGDGDCVLSLWKFLLVI